MHHSSKCVRNRKVSHQELSSRREGFRHVSALRAGSGTTCDIGRGAQTLPHDPARYSAAITQEDYAQAHTHPIDPIDSRVPDTRTS